MSAAGVDSGVAVARNRLRAAQELDRQSGRRSCSSSSHTISPRSIRLAQQLFHNRNLDKVLGLDAGGSVSKGGVAEQGDAAGATGSAGTVESARVLPVPNLEERSLFRACITSLLKNLQGHVSLPSTCKSLCGLQMRTSCDRTWCTHRLVAGFECANRRHAHSRGMPCKA